MRYRSCELTIKSENAAKPVTQPNKHVLAWIESLPRSSYVLDFGSGKLRYTIPLSRRVAGVFAVDSEVQMTRVQTIGGVNATTVEDFITKNLANVTALQVEQKLWRRRKYDRILCANVLSAIPSYGKRLAVLRGLRAQLAKSGSLLVVVQYRNSYFRDFRKNANAKRHLDGWLVRRGSTASFYGIISPKRLRRMCKAAGFTHCTLALKGESAFLSAMP